jgi:hypothetical protein
VRSLRRAPPTFQQFVSPLASASNTTTSKILLPDSASDDDLGFDRPQLALGELAERFLVAAAAPQYNSVCESAASRSTFPDQVPDATPVRSKCKLVTRRGKVHWRVSADPPSPTLFQDRLTLTDNYVKYDLKHPWRSKGQQPQQTGKKRWKSAKMYLIELKKKRHEVWRLRRCRLYPELVWGRRAILLSIPRSWRMICAP